MAIDRSRESSAAVKEDDTGNRGFVADELKAFVERVERLHEERSGISDDIADVYREGRGRGFDIKALKEVIRLRAKDPDELKERQALVDLYMGVLGGR